MALGKFDKYITSTDSGATVPSASVQVNIASSGLPASLFSDREGVTPITNPVAADANGRVVFYVAPDRFNMTATSGGFNVGYTDITVYPSPSEKMDRNINPLTIEKLQLESSNNKASIFADDSPKLEFNTSDEATDPSTAILRNTAGDKCLEVNESRHSAPLQGWFSPPKTVVSDSLVNMKADANHVVGNGEITQACFNGNTTYLGGFGANETVSLDLFKTSPEQSMSAIIVCNRFDTLTLTVSAENGITEVGTASPSSGETLTMPPNSVVEIFTAIWDGQWSVVAPRSSGYTIT